MTVLNISLILFGVLLGALLVTGLAVLLLRVKTFDPTKQSWGLYGTSEIRNFLSKVKTRKFARDPIVSDAAHEARVARGKMREGDVCPSCGLENCICRFEQPLDPPPNKEQWR